MAQGATGADQIARRHLLALDHATPGRLPAGPAATPAGLRNPVTGLGGDDGHTGSGLLPAGGTTPRPADRDSRRNGAARAPGPCRHQIASTPTTIADPPPLRLRNGLHLNGSIKGVSHGVINSDWRTGEFTYVEWDATTGKRRRPSSAQFRSHIGVETWLYQRIFTDLPALFRCAVR